MGIRLDRGLDGKYIAEVLRYYFPLSSSSSPFQSTTDLHRLTDDGGSGSGGSGDHHHHHHQHTSSPRQVKGMTTRDPQDEDDEDGEEEKNGSTSRRHTGGGGGGGGKKNDRQIRDTLAARLPDEVYSRVVDSSKDYNSRVKGLVGSVESTQGVPTQQVTLIQQSQSQLQQQSPPPQQSRQSPVMDTLVRFSDGSNEIIRDDFTAKKRESNDVDGNTMAWDNHNDHHHNNNNHHHSTSNSSTNNTSNNNDYFLSPSHDLEQFLQAYPQHVYDGLDLDADSGEMTKDNAEQFYSIVLPMADRNLYSALKQEKW